MSVDRACVAHKSHRPVALTLEEHHVIPQAWQHFWRPGGMSDQERAGGSALAAYRELSGTALWDPRTVTLCPTGHRNVHYWIVKFMKGEPRPSRESREQGIALEALDRWTAAGGSLEDLRKAGEWGEA